MPKPKPKPDNRGGTRPGAGRPSSDPTHPRKAILQTTVTHQDLEYLDYIAGSHGTRAAALEYILQYAYDNDLPPLPEKE